jgi:tetratricopeptide (TPR) repeat protein
MASQNDFDSLWDYSKPDETEKRFREALTELSKEDTIALELLTQIARAQGLQRKFDESHKTLDLVEKKLSTEPSRVKVRYLLERGRVFNSSGNAHQAHPFFEQAEEMATQLSEDFYAVDAIHMLAIIADPPQSLTLNLRAIQRAESSEEEKARNWLGSLYHNTGWSYHDMGNYESALEIFQKAEAWQRSKGRVNKTRIAKWTVARTLRSMNRVEEALSHQMELKNEFESAHETDGYVFEEIGECLLALNEPQDAQSYFAEAYKLLSQDIWLAEREPQRLERLRQLGKVE